MYYLWSRHRPHRSQTNTAEDSWAVVKNSQEDEIFKSGLVVPTYNWIDFINEIKLNASM